MPYSWKAYHDGAAHATENISYGRCNKYEQIGNGFDIPDISSPSSVAVSWKVIPRVILICCLFLMLTASFSFPVRYFASWINDKNWN